MVSRSFGYPSLLMPWDKIAIISNTEIVADIMIPDEYQKPVAEGSILLKDHILDKKIIDMDDHEVEVVYDVKLVLQNSKLYASEVDFSRHRLLRRMGLNQARQLHGSAQRQQHHIVDVRPAFAGSISAAFQATSS